MSNDQEEQVPGITFHYESAAFGRPSGRGIDIVNLKLRCEVTDLSLWEEVEKKFKEGMRVFTGADFHTEVMDVMRTRIVELERQCARLEAEKATAAADLSRVRSELQKYKEPFSRLGRALGRFWSSD